MDVRLAKGCLSLVALIAWWSRDVLAGQLSHTPAVACCLEVLAPALVHGSPERVKTDQGVQCTSLAFTRRLERAGVALGMDGRGRARDHSVVERLGRTVT
jgi:putative transposase